jgi:hypothetical protein
MSNFEKINSLNILEVLEIAWIQTKKNWKEYYIYENNKLNASASVNPTKNIWKDFWWDQEWWWTFDFIWRFILKLDTKTDNGRKKTIDWFIEKWLIQKSEFKKEFKKSPKNEDILTKFEDFRLKGSSSIFNKFLLTRGLIFDDLQNNQDIINKISKEFWIAENYYLPKLKENKDVLLIPQYDEKKKIIWMKYRRIDGLYSWENNWKQLKEIWFSKLPSWVIFDKINEDEMIICEWAPDYIILKFLWFENVICNWWWVSANRVLLKKLLYKTKKIISFYDNDKAWQQGNLLLQEDLKRPINIIKYPLIEWKEKYDVNDLFNMWYRKQDFQKLLNESSIIEKPKEEKYKISYKETFWYYYEKQTKDTILDLRISNFELKLLDILEYENNDEVERKMVIEIIQNNKKDVWIFSSRDIIDIQSFKKKIKGLNPSCSFFELKPESLDELIRFVEWQVNIPYTIIITKKWYIPKYNCWTFQEWVIFEQKFYEFDNQMTADIWKIKIKLDSKKDNKYLPIYENNYYDENIKNEIIPHFQHMFWWINWDLVLWFLISTLFINSLKKELKPFPILFIFWKKWSWKTTAMEIALKILWIENSVNTAESDSVFVDQYNSNIISSLPYWSDEYKNWKKVKEKETFYKTIFDRNWVSKWTVTHDWLWLNVMDINCSLILSWEQTPSDDAVFSRTCLIDVNGQRQWNLFDEIKRKSDYYPSIIRNILEQNNFYSLIEIYKDLLIKSIQLLKKIWIEKRLLNVYSPVVAWYLFYQEKILKNKITATEEFRTVWINDLKNKINKKEQDESEDLLDNFFNKIFYLFTKWYIVWWYEEHIRYNNTTKLMNINFSYLYTLYEDNNKDNVISKKDLKDYLEKQYWAKRSTMDKNVSSELQIFKWNNTLSFIIEKDKYPKIFDDYFNINFN